MLKARYLYSELSAAIEARKNCSDKMDRLNPNAVSATVPIGENEWHLAHEWCNRWTERIGELTKLLPHGAGIDSGCSIDLRLSHADKLVLRTSFHHMNENGFYINWTEHTVVVTPSFRGINLRISGRNQNDIKDYLYDTFDYALTREVEPMNAEPTPEPADTGTKFISVRTSERPGVHYDLVPETRPNLNNETGHYVVTIHGVEPTKENVSKIRKAINNANL